MTPSEAPAGRDFMRLRADWTARRLAEGVGQGDILDGLVRGGLSREAARDLLNASITAAEPRRPRLARVLSPLRVAVAFVLLFGAGNGILYVGQEWYHSDEVRACEDLFLRKREDALAEMELLDGLRAASPGDHRATSQRLSELATAFNAETEIAARSLARYESLIKTYNTTVDEYNKLYQRAYRCWYLIPGFHSGSTRSAPRSHVHE